MTHTENYIHLSQVHIIMHVLHTFVCGFSRGQYHVVQTVQKGMAALLKVTSEGNEQRTRDPYSQRVSQPLACGRQDGWEQCLLGAAESKVGIAISTSHWEVGV